MYYVKNSNYSYYNSSDLWFSSSCWTNPSRRYSPVDLQRFLKARNRIFSIFLLIIVCRKHLLRGLFFAKHVYTTTTPSARTHPLLDKRLPLSTPTLPVMFSLLPTPVVHFSQVVLPSPTLRLPWNGRHSKISSIDISSPTDVSNPLPLEPNDFLSNVGRPSLWRNPSFGIRYFIYL